MDGYVGDFVRECEVTMVEDHHRVLQCITHKISVFLCHLELAEASKMSCRCVAVYWELCGEGAGGYVVYFPP